jgi:hypothetical protein
VALLSGWVARGTITNLAPILMRLPAEKWRGTVSGIETDLLFGELDFPGASSLAWYIAAQFLAMLAGLAIVFIFASLNISRLLR